MVGLQVAVSKGNINHPGINPNLNTDNGQFERIIIRVEDVLKALEQRQLGYADNIEKAAIHRGIRLAQIHIARLAYLTPQRESQFQIDFNQGRLLDGQTKEEIDISEPRVK